MKAAYICVRSFFLMLLPSTRNFEFALFCDSFICRFKSSKYFLNRSRCDRFSLAFLAAKLTLYRNIDWADRYWQSIIFEHKWLLVNSFPQGVPIGTDPRLFSNNLEISFVRFSGSECLYGTATIVPIPSITVGISHERLLVFAHCVFACLCASNKSESKSWKGKKYQQLNVLLH